MRRLKMDFQPVFMAGYSLKDHDASHWERRVRPRVVPQTQATCSTCGFVAEERRLIHADEVWEFSAPPHVALVDQRAAIFNEIENLLDADDDEDMWPDHECPRDIKMNRE